MGGIALNEKFFSKFDTPYDPFEVLCLPKKKWKLTKYNYKNFLDKKFPQCFYGKRVRNFSILIK